MEYSPHAEPIPAPLIDISTANAEPYRLEFAERQRTSRARIREWKRKYKAAKEAGDHEAIRKLGPMYE